MVCIIPWKVVGRVVAGRRHAEYEAQHVSGDTSPTIRSLKLHYEPMVCIILWKVVGRVVAGRCQAEYDSA